MSMINRRTMLKGLSGTLASAAIAPPVFADTDEEPVVRAVRAIVEGIERGRDKTPSGKILFVPMGVVSGCAAHILSIQWTLQTLKERGHKIAFGYADQYDLLTDLTEPGNTEPLPDFAYRLVDPDGQQVLNHLNHSALVYRYADLSRKSLFNFCEREKISTGFNDLSKVVDSRTGQVLIDPEDGLFLQMVEDMGWSVNPVLGVYEPDGMMARNAAMTYNAFEHIAAAGRGGPSGVEIYVQHADYEHLFGAGTGNSFDKSLSELFTIRDNRVFTVDLSGVAELPPEAVSMAGRGAALSVDDLPTDIYDYRQSRGDRAALKALHNKEKAYLEKTVRNTKYLIYEQGPVKITPLLETGPSQTL